MLGACRFTRQMSSYSKTRSQTVRGSAGPLTPQPEPSRIACLVRMAGQSVLAP